MIKLTHIEHSTNVSHFEDNSSRENSAISQAVFLFMKILKKKGKSIHIET